MDSIHVGGINTSTAREGLKEMLRRVVTVDDKIQIFERYSDGDVEEDVARLLLGDDFESIMGDKGDFRAAMDLDTAGMARK